MIIGLTDSFIELVSAGCVSCVCKRGTFVELSDEPFVRKLSDDNILACRIMCCVVWISKYWSWTCENRDYQPCHSDSKFWV